MNDYEQNKRPEEIERDLDQTRAEVSSTLDAIQSKLTPGQLMDQAMDYWKRSGPADFGSNLSQSVRNNPLPVALVGIGLGWLMMSSRKKEPRYDPYRENYRDEYGNQADYAYAYDYDTASHGYGAVETNYDESGESALERAKAGIGETADRIKDKAGDLKSRAGEGVQHLREKASELGGRAGGQYEGMRDRASGMRGRMSQTAGNARERMGDLRERSRDGYYRARNSISETIDEQPLVLGAVGVAIGAALGASLPATRREDELLGERRDELIHRTRDTARQYAEPMKESAQRMAQQAGQEVERSVGAIGGDEAASGDDFAGTQSGTGTPASDRPTSGL